VSARRRRFPAWLAAAAAVVVLVVGSAGFLAGRADVDRYGNAVNALEAVNKATLDIGRRPRVAPRRARIDRWGIDDRHAPVLT
jgi:hypothetical protein